MSITVGQILSGKVTGITNFGAFVELETGETGLVHISEVADTFVKDINEHLSRRRNVRNLRSLLQVLKIKLHVS